MNRVLKISRLSLVFMTLSLGSFLGGCSSRSSGVDQGAASGTITIESIQLAGEGSDGLLSIGASGEPRYNVFKLTDPERIIVDLIDARLGDDVSREILGSGLVESVKIQSLEDSLSALVRVEMTLRKPVDYLASLDGNQLFIRLPSAMEGVAVAEQSPAVEPLPSEVQASEGAPVEPAPAPVAEAAPPVEIAPEVVPEVVPELVPEVALEAAPSPSLEEKPSETLDSNALSATQGEMPTGESVETPVQVLPPIALPEGSSEQAMSDGPPAVVPPLPSPSEEKADTAEPIPPSMPSAEAEKSSDRFPDPIPVKEKTEKAAAKKATDNFNYIPSQEVPNSGLTEGTSLLTELDAKVYTGRRVSLEFQDAEVQDVLRLIADVSKLNIVTGDDVKGTITIKLIDVPWDQALDIILTTLSLDKVQHGNILRVAPSEKLKKEREVALANDKAAKQLEPLKLKLLNVNYAKGEELKARLEKLLSERGSVDVDPRTNTIIVKDIREHVSRIENLVKALDTQTPQVRIESRIVQADDNFTRSLGIQWGPTIHLDSTNNKTRNWKFPNSITVLGNPEVPEQDEDSPFAVSATGAASDGGNFFVRLGSISNIFDLDLRLQYAEFEDVVRIVSRPSVTVLDNREARIIQGTKIPYLTTSSSGTNVIFVEAGIEINVKPQITNDGSVLMKVDTKSNEPGGGASAAGPQIAIREASTEMLVKSGRTAVLGGVFKITDRKGQGGVPGLRDLPVLGWLFRGTQASNQREEMLVFITPYILSDLREPVTNPASVSTGP